MGYHDSKTKIIGIKQLNGPLYRFCSFPSFVKLLQDKCLVFRNFQSWDDPYEGYLFNTIKTDKGKSKIIKIIEELKHAHGQFLIHMLRDMSNCPYAQSWTKLAESDALWRIYSFSNQAIRIEIDIEDIPKLNGVQTHDIIYKDFESLQEEVKDALMDDGVNWNDLFLKKRKAFEHEQEVRLLLDPRLDKIGQKITNENNSTIDVSFLKINNFIKSVMVHPMAERWYEETVRKFCAEKGVSFIGKSKLYELNI